MIADADRWNHNIHLQRVVLDAVPPGARRALDVGCGEGILSRRLREVVPEVVGLDPDEPSLELARQQGGDVEYVHGDVLDRSLDLGDFDLVAAVAVLHHELDEHLVDAGLGGGGEVGGHLGPAAAVIGRSSPRACGDRFTLARTTFVLHASCLAGADREGDVAVVVEPAKSTEIAPTVIEAYGLSPRERDVVRAIARGSSTPEIASELVLSPHTVRDYVKAVFEKVGVSSRGELVAKLFAEHYSDPFHESLISLEPLSRGGQFGKAELGATRRGI